MWLRDLKVGSSFNYSQMNTSKLILKRSTPGSHETSLVLSAIKSLLSVGILLPGFGCGRLIGLADEQKEY